MGTRIDRINKNVEKRFLYGFLIYSFFTVNFIYLVKNIIFGDFRHHSLHDSMAVTGAFIVLLFALSFIASKKFLGKKSFHVSVIPSLFIHIIAFIELGLLICWVLFLIFFGFELIWNFPKIFKMIGEEVEKPPLGQIEVENNTPDNRKNTPPLIVAKVLGLLFLGWILYLGFFSGNYLSKIKAPKGKHEMFPGTPMDIPDETLNSVLITKMPFAYERNRPLNSEVGDYIRRNSDVAYHEDRRIIEMHNSCTNCMGQDRLLTPRRVGYIKPGTKFKITGKFYYRAGDILTILSSNRRYYHYIVEEVATGHKFEIRDYDLNTIIKGKPHNIGRDDYYKSVNEGASNIKNGTWNLINYCFSKSYFSEEGLQNFIDDFKIKDEIRFNRNTKTTSTYKYTCLDMYFKSVEGFMTLKYYYDEWGGINTKIRKIKRSRKP